MWPLIRLNVRHESTVFNLKSDLPNACCFDGLLTKGLLKGRLHVPINKFILLMHLSHKKKQCNSGGFSLTFPHLDLRLVYSSESLWKELGCKCTFRLAPVGIKAWYFRMFLPGASDDLIIRNALFLSQKYDHL